MKTFNTTRSSELEQRTRLVIPGGVNSNFRKEADFQPVFMSHGVGGRMFDIDGNEYIDYSLSFGPAILGHSNDHLRQAIIRQAERMYSPSSNELECSAAEKIVEHIPCAEQVRFACSGTEAVYNVLRAARAYTGRNRIVRFRGHYHGGHDEILGGISGDTDDPTPVSSERDDDLFSQMTNTSGRARHAFSDSYLIEWNDLEQFEQLLRQRGVDIAAVIMEPVMTNVFGCLPLPGYLEGVRRLCDEYGVVLIFDEVLTGFRMGLGGAQEAFGVIPDMVTLAKAVGGGFPVSVFAGRREIMDGLTTTDVVAGGTYNGHPLGMAAIVATIEELEKEDGAAYESIEDVGRRLKDGLEDLNRSQGMNLLLQGFPGAWTFSFTDKATVSNYAQGSGLGLLKASMFGSFLKKAGVLTSLRFCTSMAHTEQDVDEALDRADHAMSAFAEELRHQPIDPGGD